jgi:hypothetical protein
LVVAPLRDELTKEGRNEQHGNNPQTKDRGLIALKATPH